MIGFGDFEIGRKINRPLTTIHVDFQGLGRLVGELLTERALIDRDAAIGTVDVGLEIIGGGMFSLFTEMNRKRPPIDLIDFLSFTTTATLHAGDE